MPCNDSYRLSFYKKTHSPSFPLAEPSSSAAAADVLAAAADVLAAAADVLAAAAALLFALRERYSRAFRFRSLTEACINTSLFFVSKSHS